MQMGRRKGKRQTEKMPEDERYRARIEEGLLDYLTDAFSRMSLVIAAMQAVMIFSFLRLEGGPFAKPRRAGYFCLYWFMLLLSVGGRFYMKDRLKKGKKEKLFFAQTVYVALLCLWSCLVTFLDQLGGNGLIVYCYMLPTIAALSVLTPRAAGILFTLSCAGLNIGLALMPGGTHNLFSNLMNSIFITLISAFLVKIMYSGRREMLHDRLVIEDQYEEIRKINEALHEAVMTDPLTGAHNRRYLEECVEPSLSREAARGSSVAGMMLDIDYFKIYNDTHGHQMGDRCLNYVARMMQEACGGEAEVIRYGGEEFFICILDCGRERAMRTAEQIRSRIEAHTDAEEGLQRATVSIGVYVQPPGEHSLDELLTCADRGLYQAKDDGRNCCRFFGQAAEQ